MDSAGGDMDANLNPAPPGGVLAAPGYEQSSYLGRGQDSTGHPTTATQRSEPRKEVKFHLHPFPRRLSALRTGRSGKHCHLW